MCAHAITLSHPGIRCRCLAAYGDAVSAVKWYCFFFIFHPKQIRQYIFISRIILYFLNRASRLGREHHDDLAQFMMGMGYATEALHLPGISKRYVACLQPSS